MVMNPLDPLRRDAERISRAVSGNPGNELEVERYHGMIVAVGGINTKTPNLPDWDISYVEYPSGRMKEFRGALMKERVRIVQVTDRRVYFEQ